MPKNIDKKMLKKMLNELVSLKLKFRKAKEDVKICEKDMIKLMRKYNLSSIKIKEYIAIRTESELTIFKSKKLLKDIYPILKYKEKKRVVEFIPKWNEQELKDVLIARGIKRSKYISKKLQRPHIKLRRRDDG